MGGSPPDLLFEVGLDGRIHDYHSPRTDLLAAPPEVFLGKKFSDVLPLDVADVCMSALSEAHEKGHSIGKQYELQLVHGRFWFELSVSRKPVNTGQEPRFIFLARDITERKQTKLLAQQFGSLLHGSFNEIYTFDASSLHFIQAIVHAGEI